MREGLGKPLLTATAIVFALLAAAWPARAEMAWRVDVTMSVSDDSQRLTLGAANDATDGFENAYETRAVLAGYLTAYFYHPEWGVDTDYFRSDIRDTALPEEWTSYVSSQHVNRDITMSWAIDAPETLELRLVDEELGTAVDMRTQSSYTYLNTSTAPRKFTIGAGGELRDVVPPETYMAEGVAGFAASSVNITYTGTDDTTPLSRLGFSWRLDAGAWSAWSGDIAAHLSGLPDGAHTFGVKARDEAGNEDLTPAEASFTVDTVAPSLVLNKPSLSYLRPVNSMQQVAVTVSGRAVDGTSGLESLLYSVVDEYGQFNQAGSVTPDARGRFSFTVSLLERSRRTRRNSRVYTITVTAADRAGNRTVKTVTVKVL